MAALRCTLGAPVLCCAPNRPRLVTASASVTAAPVSIPVKTADGQDSGTESFALKVAGNDTARHVVHRYLLTAHASRRQGSANTKTRGEVRGGGRKPFQQKKTGNARQGSSRTPLKPGGGVVFGPKPKDWSIDMNKKEKKLAMATALQSAADDIVAVSELPSIEGRKTRSLVALLSKVGVDVMTTKTLLVTRAANEDIQMSGRNIAKLAINEADCLRLTDVLNADKIVMEVDALQFINQKFQ